MLSPVAPLPHCTRFVSIDTRDVVCNALGRFRKRCILSQLLLPEICGLSRAVPRDLPLLRPRAVVNLCTIRRCCSMSTEAPLLQVQQLQQLQLASSSFIPMCWRQGVVTSKSIYRVLHRLIGTWASCTPYPGAVWRGWHEVVLGLRSASLRGAA